MNTPQPIRDTSAPTIPLSSAGVFWYSLANLGFGAFYAFNNYVLPLWLGAYTHNAILLGLLGGSHSFEGIFIQPVVGSVSDRMQGPGGRRRPFMRVFIALAALFLLLAPAATLLPGTARLAGIVVCVFLFTLTFNVAADPYQALLADITTTEQRGRVSGPLVLCRRGGAGADFAVSGGPAAGSGPAPVAGMGLSDCWPAPAGDYSADLREDVGADRDAAAGDGARTPGRHQAGPDWPASSAAGADLYGDVLSVRRGHRGGDAVSDHVYQAGNGLQRLAVARLVRPAAGDDGGGKPAVRGGQQPRSPRSRC